MRGITWDSSLAAGFILTLCVHNATTFSALAVGSKPADQLRSPISVHNIRQHLATPEAHPSATYRSALGTGSPAIEAFRIRYALNVQKGYPKPRSFVHLAALSKESVQLRQAISKGRTR